MVAAVGRFEDRARWYLPVRGERAVERRTIAIGQEYKTAASAADLKYYQTENGPISQRLNTISLLGVSFGRFGEASDSVHKLVSTMAESRCKQQELAYARGEAEEKPYLSIETAYIRRRISVAAVSCFGQRLVSRMSQVGDQNVQLAAGRRRAWGMEEIERGIFRDKQEQDQGQELRNFWSKINQIINIKHNCSNV